MKLVRFGKVGKENPGIIDSNGEIRDLTGKVTDFAGNGVSHDAIKNIRAIEIESLPIISRDTRLGCILSDVPNFYCIGLNYTKHAVETGMKIPKEPILFSKATSALSGPFDNVIIPKNSKTVLWMLAT